MPVAAELRAVARRGRAYARRRRDARAVARLLTGRAPVAPGTVEVVVYFPDTAVNVYQVRQWYEPLRRLAEDHPVAVVTREPDATRVLLAECPVPVVPIRNIAELERWLAAQEVALMLYVNQNANNFSAMRFAEPAHVFVSHGESDKAYMVSNQLKAYDAVMVAGQAAVDRIAEHVIGLPPERLVRIGRPQVDVEYAGPELPHDGRTVVLYAPTWEGDRPSMSYSSLASHGRAMVDALLTDPRFRVVYRPHPRTGVQSQETRAAHEDVARLIERANVADPSARHLVDTATAFGWHLRAADVCVTDISAVAYDWLATGRPLLVTRPASPEAVLEGSPLVAALPLVDAADSGAVVDLVTAAVADDGASLRGLAEHYFGDTSVGSALTRFLEQAASLVVARRETLKERAGA